MLNLGFFLRLFVDQAPGSPGKMAIKGKQ